MYARGMRLRRRSLFSLANGMCRSRYYSRLKKRICVKTDNIDYAPDVTFMTQDDNPNHNPVPILMPTNI